MLSAPSITFCSYFTFKRHFRRCRLTRVNSFFDSLWVKDAYRCALDPVIEDFDEDEIQVANQRAAIREQMLAQAEIVAKAAAVKN